MPLSLLFLCIQASSVILQLVAAVMALCAIPYSRKYRYPWILLSLALTFMVERRAVPLYDTLQGGVPDLVNDLFGLIISVLMVGSQIGLRSLLLSVRDKEALLTRLATTDALTGLLNRANTLSGLKAEIQRAERSNLPLSVLMLDLDFFKRVNDQHGHAIGDEVLTGFTDRCNAQLRSIDLFGRLGGEEFLIVMPGTSVEEALTAAERIRAAFDSRPLKTPHGPFNITLSLGVTTHKFVKSLSDRTQENDSELLVKTLLHRADQALYQAKSEGRNCVREWR
jgi:diguanylate cyclase (GGDEF)-like protein